MHRFLIQGLFALALFSLNSNLLLADDAGTDDSATEAAAPATSATEAEKQPDSATDTASPQPPKKKEPAESNPESKPALAEDPDKKPATTETETAATEEKLEPWQELHRQWLALDQKLKDTEQKYYTTTVKADQFELRVTFEKLISDEATPLLEKLRAEVMKAYSAKPNEDVQLVRLLVGFMVNHARMGNEVDAKEIVELLIDNKCDEKYVVVATQVSLSPSSLDILERLVERYKEALAPKDSGDDSASTPESGGSASPANEKPDDSQGTNSEEKAKSPESTKSNK
jgi:hypothetical protein